MIIFLTQNHEHSRRQENPITREAECEECKVSRKPEARRREDKAVARGQGEGETT